MDDQMSFKQRFEAARRVSAPLVRLTTANQPNAVKLIHKLVNPPPAEKKGKPEPDSPAVPVIGWDFVNGAQGFNKEGVASLGGALATAATDGWVPTDSDETPPPPIDQKRTARPNTILEIVPFMAPKTVLVMQNAHNFFGTEPNRVDGNWTFTQTLLNLRDSNKNFGRMVVLCQPPEFASTTLPDGLATDVLPFEEPVPSVGDLTIAITKEVESWNASMPNPIAVDDATMTRAVDSLRGIDSLYVAQQTIAMSITKRGLNTDELWRRNKQLINATPGLTVWEGNETYADIEGYEQVKRYFKLVLNGRKPTGSLVLIDEGEKQFQGASGSDGSSVTVEILANTLTEMEDRGYLGCIFYGCPGSGKSMMAKAIAGEAQRKLMYQDFSAAKGKYVGESNANVRRQYRVINAVSGGAALYIMTVNSMNLPLPLLRRFKLGVFFFDIPNDTEQLKIWQLYIRKYELLDAEIPPSVGWTGADIKQCCELAWSLNIPLIEAKQYIVPVAVSAAKEITATRMNASGLYLSASYPGLYQYQMPLPTRKDGTTFTPDTP